MSKIVYYCQLDIKQINCLNYSKYIYYYSSTKNYVK